MLPVSTALSGLPPFPTQLEVEGEGKGRGEEAACHSSPFSPCFTLARLPCFSISRLPTLVHPAFLFLFSSCLALTLLVPATFLLILRAALRVSRPASPSYLTRFLALLLPRSSSHFPSSACICHVRLTLLREFPRISPCLCRSRSATPCFSALHGLMLPLAFLPVLPPAPSTCLPPTLSLLSP